MKSEITEKELSQMAEDAAVASKQEGGFKDVFKMGFELGFRTGMPYGTQRSQGLELSVNLARNLVSPDDVTVETFLSNANSIYDYLDGKYVPEKAAPMKVLSLIGATEVN